MALSPATGAPGSPGSLRSANQARILTVLRQGHDALTQAELARATGLAPATVSGIVRELADKGLVTSEPGSGRRGSSVRLSPDTGVVAGVSFGHSHLEVAIGDLTGRVVAQERRRWAESRDHREALAEARAMLDALHDAAAPLRTVGLGIPAPLAGDVVRSAAIFPGWQGVNAREAAEEVFGAPVLVENDANLGALAEHRVGPGRGHTSSVFIKTSSGVGAGIVVDDRLFHGAHGTAGEIGHLTLDESGPPCRCGKRGCLEVYTSTPFVQQRAAGQVAKAHEIDDVITSARGGDVAAHRALEEAGTHLGRGIASIVNLINPAVVVVGGDMARAGDLLLESARISLRRHALDPVATTPVLQGALGSRASMVGAVLLAAERTQLVA